MNRLTLLTIVVALFIVKPAFGQVKTVESLTSYYKNLGDSCYKAGKSALDKGNYAEGLKNLYAYKILNIDKFNANIANPFYIKVNQAIVSCEQLLKTAPTVSRIKESHLSTGVNPQ